MAGTQLLTFNRNWIHHYPNPPIEPPWTRVNYYTIAYTPPGQWYWFATIEVQNDGRFAYEEHGNPGLDRVMFDDLAKAMAHVGPRWAEHQVSLAYVDQVIEEHQQEGNTL